jgi:Holliday junction resolvase RusA-like endonuclease
MRFSRRIKEVRAAGDIRQPIEGGIARKADAIDVTTFQGPPQCVIGAETLILKIPALPPVEYNQNSRAHWRTKARAGKFYKQLVVSELPRENWKDIGPLASARMKVLYHVKDNRRRDQDNHISRLKPAIDGLVASGLFLDDNKISIIEPVEFEKCAKGVEPWLELRLIDYRRA